MRLFKTTARILLNSVGFFLLFCVFLHAFSNLIPLAFYNILKPKTSVVEALDSFHSHNEADVPVASHESFSRLFEHLISPS